MTDDFSNLFDPSPEPTPSKRRRKRGAEPEPTGTALEPVTPPETFEAALGALSDEERAFVRAFIADPTRGAAAAYRVAMPSKSSLANKRGPNLLRKERVALAVRLGRDVVAEACAEAAKFDRQAAFSEMGRVFDMAMETNQATGAARAAELRARLTGTLIDRQEIRTEAFSLNLAMPTTCPHCGGIINPPAAGPVVDVTPQASGGEGEPK